jgi:phosphoglycolate phosphatase-like HAD superfamily hydrolase
LLGIATTCKRDELACYDEKMAGVLAQADAVASGDDVEKGKPHPDLCEVVLRRMGLVPAASGIAVGDTPYDAIAASKVGLRAVGVLTGGFSSEALRAAGCDLVLDRVADLVLHLDPRHQPVGILPSCGQLAPPCAKGSFKPGLKGVPLRYTGRLAKRTNVASHSA